MHVFMRVMKGGEKSKFPAQGLRVINSVDPYVLKSNYYIYNVSLGYHCMIASIISTFKQALLLSG